VRETTCPKGHKYNESSEYIDWPEGAPHCPFCFREWDDRRIAKLLKAYKCKTCAFYWPSEFYESGACHLHGPVVMKLHDAIVARLPEVLELYSCGDYVKGDFDEQAPPGDAK